MSIFFLKNGGQLKRLQTIIKHKIRHLEIQLMLKIDNQL
jgi:hypothetical protein